MTGHVHHDDKALAKEEREAMTTSSRFSESCAFRAAKSMSLGAFGGGFMGAAILSWYPDPYRYDVKNTRIPYALDAKYVVKHMRGPVIWTSITCGVFSLVDCLVEQVRDPEQQSTWVNSAVAGAAAGVIMASPFKRFDVVCTTALGMGLVMGCVEFAIQGTDVAEAKRINRERRNINYGRQRESDSVLQLKELYPEFKDL